MMHHRAFGSAMVVFAVGGVAFGQTRPVSDTQSDVPAAADVLTSDTAQAGAKEFGDACRGNARDLDKLRTAVATRASQPGLDPARAAQGRALEKEGAAAVANSGRLANWAAKAGKLMNTIDIVSPLARAGGRLYEGDRSGAMSEILSEGMKKVEVAAASTVGSVVPGGTIAGAAVAEEFHETYVKPAIERAADRQREQEARERLLGPNIPGQQVMGPDGSVRTLPPDMEVDRGTGNIRQRSPDEQAAYERKWRDDRRAAAESIHPLDEAAEELREGRITQQEFDERVAQYNEDHGRTPNDQEETAPDESEAAEAEPAEAVGPRDILSLVSPMEVTAVGVTQVDASYGEFRNIVTVTVTLRFWNVGALAPGYGSVSMTARAVASLNGAADTTTCGGSFSGGPNGTLRVTCGGDPHFQALHGGSLQNGQRIDMGEGIVATVRNPQAFANWPEGY